MSFEFWSQFMEYNTDIMTRIIESSEEYLRKEI
jgi:hypothetical protein